MTEAAQPNPAPGRKPGQTGKLFACLGIFLLVTALMIVALKHQGTSGNPEQAAGPDGKTDPAGAGTPEPENQAGRVRFESEPQGASLYLNGRLVGATPLTVSGLRPGAYGVRLELAGRQPKHLRVNVAGEPLAFREKLAPLATGVLVVDVKPVGAEVLLDGELAGVTPLVLEHAPAGQHELLIRKTNFAPFAERIELGAGEKLEFKEFALEDKVLKMLQGLVANEKQRVAHYIDLAHYYFISDDMERAVDTFVLAQEIAEKPLDLPETLAPEERALEMRLRNEDRSRLKKEIDKHKSPGYFGSARTAAFREQYDRAAMEVKDRNIAVWSWVESTGRDLQRNGDYARADALYTAHLEKVPAGPSRTPCLLEQLKTRLALRNLGSIRETVEQLRTAANGKVEALQATGVLLGSAKDRIRPNDRAALLELTRAVLEQALGLAQSTMVKAEVAFELGHTILAQKNAEAAIPFYELALKAELGDEVREDRTNCLAEALLQAGKLDEAEAYFQKLVKSERVVTREKAKAALVRIKSLHE